MKPEEDEFPEDSAEQDSNHEIEWPVEPEGEVINSTSADQDYGVNDAPRIPSLWILLIVVPLFLFTLTMQGFYLREQAGAKETAIRNSTIIDQISHARNDFEEQAAGWDSLVDAHKTNVKKLQSTKAQLQAETQLLTVQRTKIVPNLAKQTEQLETVRKKLDDTGRRLQQTQAELDLTQASKAKTEKETVTAKAALKVAETARDILKQNRDQLVIELAAENERLKQQLAVTRNNLTDVQSKLEQVRTTLDFAVAKKANLDEAITKASTDLKAAETARDLMERERDQLMVELAGQNEKLKLQTSKINRNRELDGDLAAKSGRLAAVEEELKSKQNISSALSKEVQRLTLKQNAVRAAVKQLEDSITTPEQSTDDESADK